MNAAFSIPTSYLPHLLLGIYLLILNLTAFFLMGIDKLCAIRNRQRIPERRLFLFAAIGGSVGALIGMHLFRHKTRHNSFVIGLPLILLCHFAMIALVVFLVRFS